jgi:hypothetical protein
VKLKTQVKKEYIDKIDFTKFKNFWASQNTMQKKKHTGQKKREETTHTIGEKSNNPMP